MAELEKAEALHGEIAPSLEPLGNVDGLHSESVPSLRAGVLVEDGDRDDRAEEFRNGNERLYSRGGSGRRFSFSKAADKFSAQSITRIGKGKRSPATLCFQVKGTVGSFAFVPMRRRHSSVRRNYVLEKHDENQLDRRFLFAGCSRRRVYWAMASNERPYRYGRLCEFTRSVSLGCKRYRNIFSAISSVFQR